MNTCKIVYFISILSYTVTFYSGVSWLPNEFPPFTWPRFVFLWASLLLMDQYELVPKPLTCPPFYVFYKVVAAVILANIGLSTIWIQVEDFLSWILVHISTLFEYIPMIKENVDLGENSAVQQYVQMSVALYFLLWVIKSSDLVSNFKRLSTTTSTPMSFQSPGRRSRSSRSRCY